MAKKRSPRKGTLKVMKSEEEIDGAGMSVAETVDVESTPAENSDGNIIITKEEDILPESNLEEVYQNEIIDVDPNKCPHCDKTFRSLVGVKRHTLACHETEELIEDPLSFEICDCCGEPMDTAHTTGEYKCDECDKLFVMRSSLERHSSLMHVQEGDLQCNECVARFKTQEALENHCSFHMEGKPYPCLRCNRGFSRKYHLDRHIKQTGCDGQERPSFPCHVCGKHFSRKDNLREHLRAHAGQNKRKKILQCDVCLKEFHGASLLTIHKRTHTGEKPFPCDFCEKRFPSCGAMKKHRRMHTGERPYSCPEKDCKATFAAKETLNRHVRIHNGNKPHVCQFCGKSFIQASQLRAHIFHHTGENGFTCDYCGKAFNRRTRLVTHVKFVHEGAQPFECDTCQKTFVRKEDLARHTLLHTGVKPHECPICRKAFAMKSSLKIHELTHRKEPPTSCDECGRAFIRQDCLMRHMRTKHREMLEDIMAGAEKKRLEQQLLAAAACSAANEDVSSSAESRVWSELTLTDSIKELLTLLVDEATLVSFGWPDTPVDKVLDAVIKRCGHKPASEEDYDYISRLRENAKLLFTVVIDDTAVKSLLNNQTVDEVILHVLRLAKAE